MVGYECRININITYAHKFYCLLVTACPIKGQIYYPVCAPGNLTCENPNQTYPYSCAPGCRCPYGQVLKDGKECVNKTECQPGVINMITYII